MYINKYKKSLKYKNNKPDFNLAYIAQCLSKSNLFIIARLVHKRTVETVANLYQVR